MKINFIHNNIIILKKIIIYFNINQNIIYIYKILNILSQGKKSILFEFVKDPKIYKIIEIYIPKIIANQSRKYDQS